MTWKNRMEEGNPLQPIERANGVSPWRKASFIESIACRLVK
jgi:hypothetical protein